MISIRSIGAFVSLLFLSTACLPTGGGGGSQDIKQQVARHDQQIRSLLNQVGQVETVLPGQAEMWSQLQAVRQEVGQISIKLDEGQIGGVLNERLDRLEALVRKMASQFAISTESLDAPYGASSMSPMPRLPQRQMGAVASPNSHSPVAIVSSPQALPVDVAGEGTASEAKSLFDQGIKAFDQHKYQDAVVAFKNFVAKYPSNSLASNAYFWQGESYFQMKDYSRAILAYQELLKNYGKSQKAQAAMLKQGIALYHVNEKDVSKQRLEELIKRYPNSQEASRAKQFLKTNQ